MARVCTLFSSSKGNSTYIYGGGTGILIDAGRSAKQLADALCGISVSPEELSGVFITHTHSDHISGLSVMVRRYHLPVYASEETLRELLRLGCIKTTDEYHCVDKDGIILGGLSVSSFPTSHDCEGSCGYSVLTSDGRKISLCTDTGYISESIKSAVIGSDLAVIESNHDIDMLKTGPYNAALKKRVAGMCGHLSNKSCADFLPVLAQNGTTRFILAHLSQENNTPAIAYKTACTALKNAGLAENRDFILKVAPSCGGELIVL